MLDQKLRKVFFFPDSFSLLCYYPAICQNTGEISAAERITQVNNYSGGKGSNHMRIKRNFCLVLFAVLDHDVHF